MLLDTKSRLNTALSRSIVISENRALILEDAKEALKNCLVIDDKNAFAAYHLSIIYHFLEMKNDCDFFASKAREYGDSMIVRSLICCNALWTINSEIKKEKKYALKQLDSLAANGFVPAIRNLSIYEAIEKQAKSPEEAFSDKIPDWLSRYSEIPSPLVLGAGKSIFLDAFVKGSGRLSCKQMPLADGFNSIYRWKVGTSVLNQSVFELESPISMNAEQKLELVRASKSVYQCSNQTICSIGNLIVNFDSNNKVSLIQRIER
jgi:hypothetical protein